MVIIKDAENIEQTVQHGTFLQSSYGSNPVWISEKSKFPPRNGSRQPYSGTPPDFFLTNTSVSTSDFFYALNSATYLITKGIYLYCQNYALPENE